MAHIYLKRVKTLEPFYGSTACGKDKQASFLRDFAGPITVHSVKSGSIQKPRESEPGAGVGRALGAGPAPVAPKKRFVETG